MTTSPLDEVVKNKMGFLIIHLKLHLTLK